MVNFLRLMLMFVLVSMTLKLVVLSWILIKNVNHSMMFLNNEVLLLIRLVVFGKLLVLSYVVPVVFLVTLFLAMMADMMLLKTISVLNINLKTKTMARGKSRPRGKKIHKLKVTRGGTNLAG